MNTRWTIPLAAGTAVVLCGALLAAAAAPIIGQDPSAAQSSAGIIQISTLMGTTVLDPQGQKLGRIKDFVFDSQDGQANFVVLDAETPASGHAMLVVPYRVLWVSFNPLDHRLSVVLDLRPDQFHAAPQIQNNQWQMLQNPQFLEQARNFYQVRTYTVARPIENPNPPVPPAMPQPCVNTVAPNSGLPQDLIDFYSE